jgi:hypothetical protein
MLPVTSRSSSSNWEIFLMFLQSSSKSCCLCHSIPVILQYCLKMMRVNVSLTQWSSIFVQSYIASLLRVISIFLLPHFHTVQRRRWEVEKFTYSSLWIGCMMMRVSSVGNWLGKESSKAAASLNEEEYLHNSCQKVENFLSSVSWSLC